MVEREIKIIELTFEAAHYIAGHPKCSALHGHTYFVRNIEVLYDAPEGQYVDIGVIKAAVQGLDHKLLIPERDEAFWLYLSANKLAPCKIPFVEIPGLTTVENITEFIASAIKNIQYVKSVRLQVFEGLNQGAVYEA